MDDPIFKTKYHKYKTKVKLWEKSFKEINGRVPSKVIYLFFSQFFLYMCIVVICKCYKLQYDIREAPSSIRDSYKMYYKLKTSFLEEALSDALDEDSFDLSILENSTQNESRLSGSFSEMSTPDVSALTSETSIILQTSSNDTSQMNVPDYSQQSAIAGDHIVNGKKEFEAEVKSHVNDNAWARATSNETVNTSLNDSNSKLRKSMSDKLFRNSSFLKRNPRKSLSRTSFSSNLSSQSLLSASQKECLPDLETILSQKSKQQKDNEECVEPPPSSQPLVDPKSIMTMVKNVTNNFDEEWLNRCHTANSIDTETKFPSSKLNDNRNKSSEHPKVFGLSNINKTALANLESMQPAPALSPTPTTAATEVAAKSMLSFDMSGLNLRAQNSFMDTSLMAIADDDDEVANSEDESEVNTSRQIRSIRLSNKRKHSEIDEKNLINNPSKSDESSKNNNNAKVVYEQEKHQAVTPKKLKSRLKSSQKLQNEIKANTDEKPAVSIVARKSSRNLNKAKTPSTNDQQSDQDEDSDPFAGDDSDNDPNFTLSPKNPLKAHVTTAVNVSSPESLNDEKIIKSTIKKERKPARKSTKNEEETTVKSRKRTARVKAESKPRAKVTRKTKVQSKKKPVTDVNSSISENEAHKETPDDYLLEFGIENIKSVPRMPVAELQKNTIEFSKYVYSATMDSKPDGAPKVAGSKHTKAATKNSIAKEKLEKKVAAGSLNDNYVRLNLRKKVFVRGKKTLNFSKYKKKLWKSAKAAALSGPDMDMGGCDGGILTCFQCGLPGHFAQNCKAKSEYGF